MRIKSVFQGFVLQTDTLIEQSRGMSHLKHRNEP